MGLTVSRQTSKSAGKRSVVISRQTTSRSFQSHVLARTHLTEKLRHVTPQYLSVIFCTCMCLFVCLFVCFFLQNASSLLETTIRDFKNVSIAAKQANVSDEELPLNVYFTTLAFEDFVVRLAQEQLNYTIPQLHDVRNNVGQCISYAGF